MQNAKSKKKVKNSSRGVRDVPKLGISVEKKFFFVF